MGHPLADEFGEENGDVELAQDGFDYGQATRSAARGNDISVAHRRHRDKAVVGQQELSVMVDLHVGREINVSAERSWICELDDIVKMAES